MPDFGIFRGFNEKLFGDKLVAGQLPTQLGIIGSENVVPLLLDLYPSAAAAYSLRRLRGEYTGSAIKVRRTNLDEADIGFNALGELDTTALLAFTGTGALDNGFVTKWYDQSGNAYDATQTTALNQPQIVTGGSVILDNGKPTISALTNAAGLNYNLNPNKSIINGHGYYQVGKIVDPLNTSYVSLHSFSNNTSNDIIALNGFNDNPKTYIISKRDGNTTQHGKKLLSLNNNQYLLSSNGPLNNLSAFVNNFEETTSGVNGVLQNVGIYIGSFSEANVSSNWALQEWIIYPSDQSSNRTGIEGNINDFYSIY